MRSATQSHSFGHPRRSRAQSFRLAAAFAILCAGVATTTLAATSVPPVSLNLAWDASTSTNVTGYTVYYGSASRSYTQSVPAGAVTQATLSGLTPGMTYFLAVTASNGSGLESDYSNEITFTVPTSLPNLPTLSVVRTGNKSALRWPTNYSGFTLQWSSSPSGAWSNLGGSPVISGSNYTYTNTTSSGQRYYRLKK